MRHHPNMKFIWYEELKNDFDGMILELSNFLGVELTPEQRLEVKTRTGFEAMKKRTADNSAYKIVAVANKNFFRKGEVGGWRKEFTDEEKAEQLNEWTNSIYSKIGIEGPNI